MIRIRRGGALRRGIERHHPPFWSAVVADARIAAAYRGERHDFAPGLDSLVVVARLCWVTDAFFAQCCYRARARLTALGVPVVPHLLNHLAISLGQLHIGDPVAVAPGVYLPHGRVVIDGVTRVGSFSLIHGSVTLGLLDGHLAGPVVGQSVRVAPGAKVVGPVTIGDGAQIGANAVVLVDVAPGASVGGVPARPCPPIDPAGPAGDARYHPAPP